MQTINWSPEFAVNHEIIDEQHKELFKRINDFGKALWGGVGKDDLEKHMNFLADYVVSHFGTEEELMQSNNYGAYETHKAQHDAFVKDMTDVLKRLGSEGFTPKMAIEVFYTSCNWVKTHVVKMDQELGKFLDK